MTIDAPDNAGIDEAAKEIADRAMDNINQWGFVRQLNADQRLYLYRQTTQRLYDFRNEHAVFQKHKARLGFLCDVGRGVIVFVWASNTALWLSSSTTPSLLIGIISGVATWAWLFMGRIGE